ncbi:hypothetical protein ACJ72_04880, partial [Emergomyces africanus]
QRAHSTPKSSKQPRQSTSSLPAPPLDDVHAAFVEFRAKEEDKVRRYTPQQQQQQQLHPA